MARIVPYEIDAAARRGRANPELDTLRRLEDALSDEFTVYHGVHWAHADASAALYGEIDFIVANRLGRLIAIEQKNGPVAVGANDLVKDYASGTRGLRAQVGRNLHHLMSEFGRRHPDRRLDIDHLLYLPDHVLTGPLPASIDPDRVVDARSRERLAARIVELFHEREHPSGPKDTHRGAPPPDPTDVHQFLADYVDAMPCVDAMRRVAHAEYARRSGGLAIWARRIEAAPFRLRVVGTAGSGKTQLALEELRAAKAAGRSAMYLCFNRALADAMRRAAPAPDACSTFHELGAWCLRGTGEAIDYAEPGVFERLAAAVVDAAPALESSVDLLIVDEGQDFQPEWAQAVLRLVRPDGRALWLEDPTQNLYRRTAVELPGWVTMRSPVNYRSPHVLVTLANTLGLSDAPIEAGSAVHGFDPTLETYSDEATLVEKTSAAVAALVAAGHAPADIAVISWHGRERSRVIDTPTLGGQPTRRFTGRFTDDGEAVFSDGELQLETLFRFKGQAADCVVITEVDFDEWTEEVRRRLFVAMTRARLRVVLVASARAEGLILDRIGAASEAAAR